MSRETSCKTTCAGSGSLAYCIVVLLVLAVLLALVLGVLDYTTNQYDSIMQCRLCIWQSALFGVAVFLLMLSLFARSRSRHPPHGHGGGNSGDDPCFNLHTLSSAALGGLGAGLLCYLTLAFLFPHLPAMGESSSEDTLSLYLAALGIIMTLVTIGVLWTSDRAIAHMKETEQRVETHANEKLRDMDVRATKLEQSDNRQWQRLKLQNLALFLIHDNQKQLSILEPSNPEYHIRTTLGLLYTKIRKPGPLLRYLAEHYEAPGAFDLMDEEKDLLCELESFYRDFPEETEQDEIELAWFDQIDRKTRFRDQCNQSAAATT